MPTPASLPLRVQAIDRVATVLGAITAGSDYWYTPGRIAKLYIPNEEIDCEVTYMIFAGIGEGTIEFAGAGGGVDSLYMEDVFITIQGVVRSDSDTATMVGKCIRDIRKAIDADSCSGVAGTLGAMFVETRMEKAPITDNGWFANLNYGRFEIQLRVKTEGTYANL